MGNICFCVIRFIYCLFLDRLSLCVFYTWPPGCLCGMSGSVTARDMWRSDRLADTQRIPLPSLVKPEWPLHGSLAGAPPPTPLPPQQTKSWLKQPGLPVAIVIGNTGSPHSKTCFWHPCSRGFYSLPLRVLTPPLFILFVSLFLHTGQFFYYAWCTSLVAHEFVIILGRGVQGKLG